MTNNLHDIVQYCFGSAQTPPSVAISACLHGAPVRYDGSDKYLGPALPTLGQHLALLPFCPEVGAGFGVPRPPVHWVEDDCGSRTVQLVHPPGTSVEAEISAASQQWCQLHPIEAAILKAKSPSCGTGTTPIHSPAGKLLALGDGVFTSILRQRGIAIVDELYFTSPHADEWFILGCYLQQQQNQQQHKLRQQKLRQGTGQAPEQWPELQSELQPELRRRARVQQVRQRERSGRMASKCGSGSAAGGAAALPWRGCLQEFLSVDSTRRVYYLTALGEQLRHS
ncbi:DUF523 domain-containing protein [Pseudomaricurvus alcaniphilus]|uniref:DUF523 domain-containing protein n=1 Tax=Pseudomaricurvus alcaniphilus TaxID=1166482 RepID=UPI00140C80D9|nr:DUF523 domain-containing protein [Pseudomaricurvus alcaniphilus]NHN38614.1 DUF523 domain-containing protein [Pseudomaricurvus alcaniphilus]